MPSGKLSRWTSVEAPSRPLFARDLAEHQDALDRCVAKLNAMRGKIGLRNPKHGRPDKTWNYCGNFDWVVGFYAGQLWLAFQLTGDAAFLNGARARREVFRRILDTRAAQDHDVGFQISLSCVAEWRMTGDAEAHALGIRGAESLVDRFNPTANFIQAWNPGAYGMAPEFANGRMIADSMMNLAILHWAYRETGRLDFREIADAHAETVLNYIVRPDGTSNHCFCFDPVKGTPIGGHTYQGYSPDSWWSRGHSWLVHGFAQNHLYTGDVRWLNAARNVAGKVEEAMNGKEVMPWDFRAPADMPYIDSSASAITAAGLYLMANSLDGLEAERWRGFGDRLMAGLLKHCDLTRDDKAMGMLDHGASHVPDGLSDTMLPYGDYFFMEALMRSLGHDSFFW